MPGHKSKKSPSKKTMPAKLAKKIGKKAMGGKKSAKKMGGGRRGY